MSWVDSKGVTIRKMVESNRLWVAEKLPNDEGKGFAYWKATAEKKDTFYTLIAKWTDGVLDKLPRSTQSRERSFVELLEHNPNSIIVIEDAHLLKPMVLKSMRLLSERGAPVILVGDVARIMVATEEYPEFYQRADYLIKVSQL